MKKILFAVVIILIAIPSISLARSGCCSYHGGVCGCECCDGSSLSSTCAPYYPACGDDDSDDEYIPATRKITVPNPLKDVYLDYAVVKTGDNKFTVTIDWSDPSKSLTQDYSIRLAKTAGDPGPLVDTSKSVYSFTDVPSGKYVVSLKTKFVGSWTDDYVSWNDIDVSEKTSGSGKSLFVFGSYISQIPAVEPKCENEIKNEDTYFAWAGWATIIAIILGISLIVSSNNKEKLERELNKLKYPDLYN